MRKNKAIASVKAGKKEKEMAIAQRKAPSTQPTVPAGCLALRCHRDCEEDEDDTKVAENAKKRARR